MPNKKIIEVICQQCGSPLIPDKEAVVFGTKMWDEHTFRFDCKCNKNKKFRLSIG